MKRFIFQVLSCVLLSVWMGSAIAAKLTATVDRTALSEDETLHLVIRYDSGRTNATPDFSTLKSNFDIVNQGSSIQNTIINGTVSSFHEWQFVLLPKKTGKLLIPSFSVEGNFSDAIEIEVGKNNNPSKPDAANSTSDLYFDAHLDKNEAYVGEMVILTLRLYTAVTIAPPKIPDPVIPNVMIEKLGESQFQTRQNGRDYVVVEMQYALVANRSGKITLPRERHEIQQIVTTRSRSLFDDFPGFGINTQSAQPRYVSTPELTLTVNPQPEPNNDNWLPSQDVTISDNWSADKTTEVGVPVTRVIEINALGNLSSSIPPLPEKPVRGLKTYSEKPELTNTRSGKTIQGTRKENIAIVATQPGNYTLPAITLRWWSTKDNEFKTSTLPSRTLTVTGVAQENNTPVVTDSHPNAPVADSTDSTSSVAPSVGNIPATVASGYLNPYPWMASTLLFLVTTVTFLVLYLQNNPSRPITAKRLQQQRQQAASQLEKKLIRACQRNDAHETRRLLIELSSVIWPEQTITSLDQVKAKINKLQVTQLIDELDSSLYGAQGQWQGKPLADYLAKAGLSSDLPERTRQLPPLYS